MYGGASKIGRGGGRGGPRNRNSFPPPQSHRSVASTGRLPVGGSSATPRNRTSSSSVAPVARKPQEVEETFSLVTGKDPLAFSMIIRLAPDLVDEIRRVEAQGGTAKIKFDSISNSTSGNVVNVGGKEFKFTWSRDGDLCDIYEERESGEDGNGLLVESGCAWRKLNVQRILDESTKNHVKMRSEQAERKANSRKAIVLDPENPSMKNQIKQLAAVEGNPWRNYNNKKEAPFKKRKVDLPQVGGSTKSAYKSGLASVPNAKGRHSASPLPSTPEKLGASPSPLGYGSITKSKVNNEDLAPVKLKNKETVLNFEKDIPTRLSATAEAETAGRQANMGGKPMDLQSMLITILKENPKGMILKSLEKAVADNFPNSGRKLEPIIKKIATFQAPGRYFLKKGVEFEGVKKPFFGSGSSPEENHHTTPYLEHSHDQAPTAEHSHDQIPAPVPSLVEKVPVDDLEEQVQPNSGLGEKSNAAENNDIHHSPDFFGEKKVSDNSEGKGGSSSDSGSDSDSESDSSGSDSRSHSKSRSRSPVGSGSGSSSDSDSDASSNSKEGSDEDVDIMTSDDDKDPKGMSYQSPKGLTSPLPGKNDDGRPVHDHIEERQDVDGCEAVDIEGLGSDAVDVEGLGSDAVDIEGLASDAVDIEGLASDAVDIEGLAFDAVDIEGHGIDAVDIKKGLHNDVPETEMAVNTSGVANKESVKSAGETSPFYSDHDELQERQNFIGNLFEDVETNKKDSFRHEQLDTSGRISKGKSKRPPDLNHFDEKSGGRKRLKPEFATQPPISLGKDFEPSENVHNLSPNRDGNHDYSQQKKFNQISSTDFQPSGPRSFDQNAHARSSDKGERLNKHTESSGHNLKVPEKRNSIPVSFPAQYDKSSRDIHNEDNSLKDKKLPRNTMDSGAGSKHSKPNDLDYRKHSEIDGKFKDGGNIPSSYMESSPKEYNRTSFDRMPVNGRSNLLQRELSDLELGELREPPSDETLVKKQFERKESFKHIENKLSTLGNFNSDSSKGKPVGKATYDMGKSLPANPSVGIRRTPDHLVEESSRPLRVGQSQPQHHLRTDSAEVGSQGNKLLETNGKSRQNDGGAKQGVSIEGYGESNKKVPGAAPREHGSKRENTSHYVKASKTHISNTMGDLIEGWKDTSLTEGNNGGRKTWESSPDKDSSYVKFEKDEPELKGPIKEFSQYRDYVQEYQDKYDSYCTLNKILEGYRNEFSKMGKDLDFAKDKDMERYHKVLAQLRDSYHRCGARHRRLKKIFVVLHEELRHIKQRIKDFAVSYRENI